MKLSNQAYVPLLPPLTNVDVAQPKLPEPPGLLDQSSQPTKPGAHTLDPNAYPEGTAEEHSNRTIRGFRFRPRIPATRPLKPPKPLTPPKPPRPAPSASRPSSVASAANTARAVGALQFPPIASSLAIQARNSFVEAGVSTLINLPLSVAQHVTSKAMTDRIDAQSKMPGAEKKNVDGTKSTVDPSATDQQKIEARLEGAEIKTELLANTILSINEGADANAVGKDPAASTDINARLTGLEKRMDTIEGQMEGIAERYGLVYCPYSEPESSQAPTDKSRVETIEQRYKYMNTMVKKLKAAKEIDKEDDAE
ncbi:hypothetical protein [Pseudomonas sp. WS 5146]|nr:hypothetical protein [Pseudomonas sp. WS 5146]